MPTKSSITYHLNIIENRIENLLSLLRYILHYNVLLQFEMCHIMDHDMVREPFHKVFKRLNVMQLVKRTDLLVLFLPLCGPLEIIDFIDFVCTSRMVFLVCFITVTIKITHMILIYRHYNKQILHWHMIDSSQFHQPITYWQQQLLVVIGSN